MISRLSRYRFPRTSIITFGLTGVLAGLVWARFGATTSTQLTALSFLLIPLTVRSRWPVVFVAMVIGLNIGLWRGHNVFADLSRYQPLYDRKIEVVGRVSDDAAYSYQGQTEFHITNIRLDDESLIGRIRIRGFGGVGVRRGDVVRVSGKIREGFGNRQGSISYANIELLSRQASVVEDIRAKFFAGVNTALPEPNASLGLGFLVGLRTLLPDQLLDQLSATGLTHIVAVSGYNLTILVRLMRRLFAKKSVYLSVATSAALIIGFLLVTGLSPSISRAAVVSGFALTAWYYGRRIKPILLILLSAVITAMINPFYAWYDIGWYLSFSAFFGVLVLAPLFTKRYLKTRPKLLGQVVIETISAQIMALPIIAVIFGELSMISISDTALIVRVPPTEMILTIFAGLGGMFGPLIAGWISWPANLILTFMTDLVSLMAAVPWALKEVNLNWLIVSLFYGLVLFVAIVIRSKLKTPLSGTEIIE